MSTTQTKLDLPFLCKWDRARYETAWLMMRPSEDVVEKTILESLRFRGIAAQKIDAGGRAMRGKIMQVLRRFGIKPDVCAKIAASIIGGAPKGWVDITGVMPGGRALFLEIKQPEWLEVSESTGRIVQKRAATAPEPEQLDFLIRMHNQGALVGVAWSASDLDLILKAGK